MDEKEIIELYWCRSELAIRETDRKYGKYCNTIAFNILGNQQDSEECVNDTYWKVWNAIPPKRPAKFSAFLGKITRNLALNRYQKLTADKRGGGQVWIALDELAECIPDPNHVERIVEDKLLTDMINRFLSTLPKETRQIFLRRYWGLFSVDQIAADFGTSASKCKMALLRTRRKLKSFLEKEGISI